MLGNNEICESLWVMEDGLGSGKERKKEKKARKGNCKSHQNDEGKKICKPNEICEIFFCVSFLTFRLFFAYF